MSPLWARSLISTLILALCLQLSHAHLWNDDQTQVKTSVYLSKAFVMKPGSVVDRYYYGIDFPKGHVALKSFNAEVVDETGVPVPLHETYLHHWVVARYYQRIGAQVSDVSSSYEGDNNLDFKVAGNSGICQNGSLGQYFGLGSETRGTETHVPDPYGIEIGKPEDVPAGFEEKWMLNIHAIDTRNVVDRLGCTECRCDLYNVTKDKSGQPLRPGYVGGLRCCYDETQCRVKDGVVSESRTLYLRYTVKWVEWKYDMLPVRIYIFDVTDTPRSSGGSITHYCRVEYDVEQCTSVMANGRCIDSKTTSLLMPRAGYVVYGVAHQHSGGAGSTLYGEDGRVICSSIPKYGTGEEAGNERGYIVGMSTCYPQSSSYISGGETMLLESNYSSAQDHTGVMGLFYLMIADEVYKPELGSSDTSISFSTVLIIVGVAVAAAAVLGYQRRSRSRDQYQPMLI
ncbi:hypothetical protein Droror1_Dr00021489 [Drosera rotundifolia]